MVTGQQFTLVAGDHEITVVEVGAGLRRYLHRGVEVTAGYAEDEAPPKGTGIALVPWPNRLRRARYRFDGVDYQLVPTELGTDNAIHGLGRWARWVARTVDFASVTLELDIVPQPGWPFEVLAEVTYALHLEHGLTVTARATNHGVARAPFGAGFHPYLSTRGHQLADVTLKVPAGQRLITDEAGVPVGHQSVAGTPYDLRRGRRLRDLRLDDGFTDLAFSDGRGAVEVRTRSGGAQLWFDATFGYVQVFTPDPLAQGRPAVAVEPMTCPADAFNSGAGLIVLEPGGTWTGLWGIRPL